MVGRVKVGDLAEGVDSGVGTTTAMKAKGFLGNFGEGLFNVFLDRFGIGLDLPAAKAGSVVGDGEFEVHDYQARYSLRISRAAAWSMMDLCFLAFLPAS